MSEIIDIVNEKDNVIGRATKEEVLKKNLIHRGVVIFVFNTKGEIFVHKRTSIKTIYPGMYSMTVGGSVLSKEGFDQAAARETTEETGIKKPQLQFLFKSRYKSKLDNVMAGVYKLITDKKIKIQKEEIEKGAFVSIRELKKMVLKEKFCPDALQYFRELKEKGV